MKRVDQYTDKELKDAINQAYRMRDFALENKVRATEVKDVADERARQAKADLETARKVSNTGNDVVSLEALVRAAEKRQAGAAIELKRRTAQYEEMKEVLEEYLVEAEHRG